MLFGSIEPVRILADGDEATIRRTVIDAIGAGVDAVWPGCDLWPLMPSDHLRAMVSAAQ